MFAHIGKKLYLCNEIRKKGKVASNTENYEEISRNRKEF